MRSRGGKLAVVASMVAGAALALVGCGTIKAGDTGTDGASAAAVGFKRYAGAVDYPAVTGPHDKGYVAPREGLRQLVPLGDCVLGEGTFANGYHYVNVNWTGSKGCTKLSITPKPGADDESDVPYSMRTGWLGGGLPGDVVVPWGDGSLIGVGVALTRRTPDGEQVRLATLPLTFNTHPEQETADDASVNTAVKVGSRLLIGGGQTVNQVETPYVFASDDAGTTVRSVPLPTINGGQPATPVGDFGVHGKEIVAFGAAATNAYDFHSSGTIPFWRSADGGAHWTSGEVTRTPPGTQVSRVLYASGHWFAVGGRAKAGAFYDSLPLVLTSRDGTHWTRMDTSAMGTGEITAATVDSAGRLVLVGSAARPKSKPDSRTVWCASVWVGNGTPTGFKRGSLGCSEDPPTTAVTLADGRVLIAGNRDLWLSREPGSRSGPSAGPGRGDKS
ncbi:MULTISPECIES: hypothetical protein [unclassified Streptomyces]|jgi:hypothetical protein|uniref:hypothetical protein n=1 Tax=unclassified Streptomyces TaxID=2593676 RepID=UPI000D4DED26|nr:MULTISPECIES: hypothetical protein [unclassified Streptomyces]PTM92925.1 hypothetical protein C7821_10853 [Streptomyces sp. VMFN-G11Ma]